MSIEGKENPVPEKPYRKFNHFCEPLTMGTIYPKNMTQKEIDDTETPLAVLLYGETGVPVDRKKGE